jgi:hypothetical protein
MQTITRVQLKLQSAVAQFWPQPDRQCVLQETGKTVVPAFSAPLTSFNAALLNVSLFRRSFAFSGFKRDF